MFVETVEIINEDLAKEFYLFCDCSHFLMGRGYWPRYLEYRALEIPKSLENQWLFEEFNVRIKRFHDDENLLSKGMRFSKLVDMAISDMNQKYANALYLLADSFVDEISTLDKLIVVESILGRGTLSARSGVLFALEDINEFDYVYKFLTLIEHVLNGMPNEEEQKRFKSVKKTFDTVRTELRK